ncbi:MAG: enoyl-CoA hydratase/isomerase family protein [Candidatus Lokiarchaeota archaeon]|nr:enoyl-CoA hydratase/isomerase family protein [Candidatus Lokiarchaeota archaeon]
MSEDLIQYKVEEKVAIITINRPDKANSVTSSMLQDIYDYIVKSDENEAVNCVLVRSVGDRFFSAGYDLKEVKGNPEKSKIVAELGRKVNEYIMLMKKPVITQIQGIAVGFGVLITVASDIRIFADRPKEELFIQLPELYISAFPQTGASIMPLLAFGATYAKNLMFTNKRASLEDLKNINFPSLVFPLDKIEEETLNYAKQLGNLNSAFLFTYKSMTAMMSKEQIGKWFDLEDECASLAYDPKKSMKELDDFIKNMYKKYT